MKVLIIKIGAIGDAVMALGMCKALRERHPQASVTWLCGRTIAPLLRATQLIDSLLTVDEHALLAATPARRFLALGKVWLRLLGRRFDLILIGHTDPRYRLLAMTAQARARRCFDGNGRRRHPPLPGRYHADEYLRLFTREDGPAAPRATLPTLAPALSETLQPLLAGSADRPLIALAPGGAKNVLRVDALRRWPIENYVDLAGRLLDAGYRVVLTGATTDAWVQAAFAALPVIDLVGKTSLVDLVAVYRASRLLVTHDSGPLHLAKLAGTPVVALFGPTDPKTWVSPIEKVQVLWGGETLACRPCYDGKNFARCENNACMQSIRIETVMQRIKETLGAHRP